MSTTPHRPQVPWFPMGGLLGALAGAVTGVVMLLAAGVFVVATHGTAGTLLADAVVLVLVASLLGGPLARRLADFQRPRPATPDPAR